MELKIEMGANQSKRVERILIRYEERLREIISVEEPGAMVERINILCYEFELEINALYSKTGSELPENISGSPKYRSFMRKCVIYYEIP